MIYQESLVTCVLSKLQLLDPEAEDRKITKACGHPTQTFLQEFLSCVCRNCWYCVRVNSLGVC